MFVIYFSESHCRKLSARSCWSCCSAGVLGGNPDSAEFVVSRQNCAVPDGSALLRCLHSPPGGMCAEAPLPAA